MLSANRGQNEDWVYSAVASSLSHSHPMMVITVSFLSSLSCSGLTFAFQPQRLSLSTALTAVLLKFHLTHCLFQSPLSTIQATLSFTNMTTRASLSPSTSCKFAQPKSHGAASSECPTSSWISIIYKINSSFYTQSFFSFLLKVPWDHSAASFTHTSSPTSSIPCGGLASQMTPNKLCPCRTSSSPKWGWNLTLASRAQNTAKGMAQSLPRLHCIIWLHLRWLE